MIPIQSTKSLEKYKTHKKEKDENTDIINNIFDRYRYYK